MSAWRLVLVIVLLYHVTLLVRSAPDLSEARIHGGRISEADLQEIEDDLVDELDAESRSAPMYLNEWAAEIPEGREVADIIARDLGYVNTGQIGVLDNHFLFEKLDHPARSKRSAHHHTRSLRSDNRVVWAEQQKAILREKRDFIHDESADPSDREVRFADENWNRQWYLSQSRQKRTADTKRRKKAYKEYTRKYDDDWFQGEWYLFPELNLKEKRVTGEQHQWDLGAVPVWARGITGKGIGVTVVDDGLEWIHPDIAANYHPEGSYDFNGFDDDPTPHYDKQKTNKHGTRCAGEIAMIANNKKCGVGVAYNAKIGGIRMLDGVVTDKLESLALCYNLDKIHIFTCSWGPSDNGGTVEAPGRLAEKCFIKGVTDGRDGLGTLYIWASGNGGRNHDNCDCDGYTGSIYTISISSASASRKSPWYAEQCASTMATAYSSGDAGEKKITSTDLNGTCTDAHTGTSASAPLAAGLYALLLEASDSDKFNIGPLTWRDVQHLTAWTAEFDPLSLEKGWKKNGAGFYVNSRFGFGLMNADLMITAADAEVFRTVPEKSICTVDSKENNKLPVNLESGNSVEFSIDTTGCKDQENEVNFLEHLQLRLHMGYSKRGAVEITITSPLGTQTTLLSERPRDTSKAGFKDWAFMSLHTWGERPQGVWKVVISDSGLANHGTITRMSLVLHGTKEQPFHMETAGGCRVYESDEDQTCANNDVIVNEP